MELPTGTTLVMINRSCSYIQTEAGTMCVRGKGPVATLTAKILLLMANRYRPSSIRPVHYIS